MGEQGQRAFCLFPSTRDSKDNWYETCICLHKKMCSKLTNAIFIIISETGKEQK